MINDIFLVFEASYIYTCICSISVYIQQGNYQLINVIHPNTSHKIAFTQ